MFSNVGLPHGWCFFWQPGLLWLHVVSDSLIGFAYMLIPLALLRIIRGRRDIPFNGVVLCFAAFILACGATHAMDVYTLWHPVYWLSGWLKAFAAAVSLLTVVVLLRLTPAILRFPSSAEVKELNHRLNSVLESTSDGVLSASPRLPAPSLRRSSARACWKGQIMLNLLNNAFDAVDGSGSPERWVRMDLGLWHGDGPPRVRIEVVDSGPGVDDKSKAHLMEPFFTTKPVGAGLGVGLSLSRAIAQDHQGSLDLISGHEHTCFRLLLPVRQRTTSTPAAHAFQQLAAAKEPS